MKLQRLILSAIVFLFLVFFADSVLIEASWFRSNSDSALAAQLSSAVSTAEETLNGRFHLRYAFYEWAGLFNRCIGRRYMDNIYRLRNGHLVSVGKSTDVSDSVAGMKAFHEFCSSQGLPLLYVSFPRQSPCNEDLAMFGESDSTELKADRFLTELTAAGIDTLDMRPYVEAAYPNHYDAFFKTEHHWKVSTGLYCTQILSEQLRERYGLELAPENIRDEAFSVTLMKNCWLGERGRKTGSLYSGMDDFELIKPVTETHFHLTIPSRKLDKTGDFSIMMDEARYDTGFWGRRYGPSFYYSYLFGNDPIQIIQNLDHAGGKILIIKDSFAQAVVPFLAMTANTVVSWDLRYNNNSLREYISENDFDIVLVMYNESMINGYRQDRFVFDFS